MWIPEKGMFPSKLLMCLITISMFLLLVSSLFLLQSSGTSFVSTSVFRLILINNTSVYFKPNVETQHTLPTAVPSLPACQTSKLTRQSRHRKCYPNQALVKVFMYDLPPEFHFGLMGWTGKTNQTIWPDIDGRSKIPSYPGGLNLQHSMEYWLTLDLLSSNVKDTVRSCTAIRVKNASEADVIFVPFFSSISYNRYSKMRGAEKIIVNNVLQNKLVKFLNSRQEWKRYGGKDHLIVAHHPNSMVDARKKLGSAMFVLADFGRYATDIANLEKDVIAPYMHVVRTVLGDSAPFESRTILAYFQGAIHRKDGGAIRQELYRLLKDEPDVHFTYGSVRRNGIIKARLGMGSSKFCLNIAGDTPSSNRLFDAIASHCVPVIISDNIELPFEQMLDYSEFCIFVRSEDAVKEGYLLNLLREIKRAEWIIMWERLKAVVKHFEYRYPSQPGDAVDMIWREVSRKVAAMRFKLHRRNRYMKTQLLLKSD